MTKDISGMAALININKNPVMKCWNHNHDLAKGPCPTCEKLKTTTTECSGVANVKPVEIKLADSKTEN